MRRKIMISAFGIATMVNAMCAEPSLKVPPSQFHTPHIPPFNKNLDLAPVAKGGDALGGGPVQVSKYRRPDNSRPAGIASVGGPCEEYREAHEVDVKNGGPISPIGGMSFPKCR